MQAASEELVKISYSKLAAYLDCPRRCKDQVATSGFEGAGVRERGNVFHDAIAEWCASGDVVKAKSIAAGESVEYGLSSEDANAINEMIEWVHSSRRFNVPPERTICIESNDGHEVKHGKTFFVVPLPVVVDGKRIALRGAFDRVWIVDHNKAGIVVDDWKSGYMDAKPLQEEVYAVAAHLMYHKVAPVGVRFIYPARKFATRIEWYDAEKLGTTLEYLAVLAASFLRETEWPEKLNPNCKSCSLKMTCGKYLDAITNIPTALTIADDDFASMVKWKKHVECVRKAAASIEEEIKEKMMSYLEKNGSVPDSEKTGNEYRVAESPSTYVFPVEPMRVMLESRGLKWLDAMSFTKEGIEKLLSSAVSYGQITEQDEKEIWKLIEGEKDKAGKWKVQPIRTVETFSRSIVSRKAQPNAKVRND